VPPLSLDNSYILPLPAPPIKKMENTLKHSNVGQQLMDLAKDKTKNRADTTIPQCTTTEHVVTLFIVTKATTIPKQIAMPKSTKVKVDRTEKNSSYKAGSIV
jgi:hypothetical protein